MSTNQSILNFDYPLKYSYFIEGDNLKTLKTKVSLTKKLLMSCQLEQVQVPFLTSKEALQSVTSEYNKNNLINVYPAGDKKKVLYFAPYMLFLQGLPLIKSGRYSYKDYPLKWFVIGPSYKGLIKSEDNPYQQTEEIYSIQGSFFYTNDGNHKLKDELEDVLEKVFKLNNKEFEKTNEGLFFNTPSIIYKDSDGNFLGGYHELTVKDLKKNGIQIKDNTNKESQLHMYSFAISQNCFI